MTTRWEDKTREEMAAIECRSVTFGKQGIGRCLLFAVLMFCGLSIRSQIEVPYYLSTGVDELPENFGGKQELKRFLDYHMIYPAGALKKRSKALLRSSIPAMRKALLFPINC